MRAQQQAGRQRLLTVSDATSLAPVRGARVRREGEAIGVTDALGELRMTVRRAVDTLQITAIGYRSAFVTASSGGTDTIQVTLVATAVALSDLVATTSGTLVRGGSSEWAISGAAASTLPAVGEPDAFRVLKLVPAVSFTSILSSRPLIRGVDADDAGFVIDGHEAINLFHIGRFFSAFPALAVGQLRVVAQPGRLDVGRSTSGRIEIDGAEWQEGRRTELQYGLGAWSLATGWKSEHLSGFFAGRTIEGALAGAADDGAEVSLSIGDLYGRVDLGTNRHTSFTVFRSIDRVVDRSPDGGAPNQRAGLDWGNLILGVSTRLLDRPGGALAAHISFSEHFENGTGIPARGTSTGVDNLARRFAARVAGSVAVTPVGITLEGGVDVGQRQVRNVLTPDDPSLLPAAALDLKAMDVGAHLALVLPFLGGELRGGARIDAFNGASALQPRLSLAVPFARSWWVSAGVGRAARLIHLISDSRSEPKVAYYDLWLPADDEEVPIAVADHFSAEVGWNSERSTLRLGVFSAEGSGQMELVPEYSARRGGPLVRRGRLRVRGAEVEGRTASADGRWLGIASYSLQRSDRNWSDGWLPWVNDRRHQLRLSAVHRPSNVTTFSASVEAASGQPYTPVAPSDGFPVVFGRENSARGRLGIRADIAVQRQIRGPFGTEIGIGFSVTNLALGDQAPREGEPRFIDAGPGVPRILPGSSPLFTLPPIPTLLLRVKF